MACRTLSYSAYLTVLLPVYESGPNLSLTGTLCCVLGQDT